MNEVEVAPLGPLAFTIGPMLEKDFGSGDARWVDRRAVRLVECNDCQVVVQVLFSHYIRAIVSITQ